MDKSLKIHLWILIAITLFYKICIGLFTIDSYISIPQFTDLDNFKAIQKIIDEKEKRFIFILTFVVDFIWAPVLFSFGWHLLRKYFKSKKLKVYIGTSILALFFDYWENLTYVFHETLFKNTSQIEILRLVKEISYAITVIVVIYHIIRYLYNYQKAPTIQFIKSIVAFLKFSPISLLIIAILILLITQLGQVSTVIVDLFYRPINLFLIYIYMFFTAIVLSHYPAYIEAGTARDKISWCIKPLFVPLKWFGIGLIHYKVIDSAKKTYNSLQVQSFRHFLGLGILSAFIYVLLFVGNKFYSNFFITGSFSFLILAGSIFLYKYVEKQQDDWINKFYKLFRFLSIILMVTSTAVTYFLDWSLVTLILSIITVLSLLVFFIFFRKNRHNTLLKDHVVLIRVIAVIGMLSLIPLALANFFPDFWSKYISSLFILLLYLVNGYGIIMILLKHIFFYYDEDICRGAGPIRKRFRFYLYLIPTVILLLSIWVVIVPRFPSNQHQIPNYAENGSIALSEFENGIRSQSGEKTKTYFQVASYGGGIKANLWTLLTLNKLLDATNGKFIDATLSMSGTSGGAMGLGNYAVLYANEKKKNTPAKDIATNLQDKIYAIGNFNHLFIDLTYVFGKDLIREMIPHENYKGTDRSHKAMENYARLTYLDSLGILEEDTTFKSTWKAIYNNSNYYPALIINSFATSGTQGVSFCMETPHFKNIFPGAIDVVDVAADTSIGYYGALSTSNRFPIFSPTANVGGKGHFLDGGYFDNSGISSSLAFSEHLLDEDQIVHSDSSKTPVNYVVIDNSKGNYIKYKLNDLIRQYGIKENSVGELSAIIVGVAGLDKVPSYFEGVIENRFDPVHLFLPQPINYNDIVSAYDGIPKLPPHKIVQFLEEQNEKIIKALDEYEAYELDKWGIIEPALARLNSVPAIRYQEAMIYCHPDVLENIRAVKNRLE